MKINILINIAILVLLTSCASIPLILKDAVMVTEAVEVGLEAEEKFTEDVNKGNVNVRPAIEKPRP